MDPQMAEWNRFNQMLNNELVNYDGLLQYVENINITQPTHSFQSSFEKR